MPTAGTGSSYLAASAKSTASDFDLVAAVGAKIGGRRDELLNFCKLLVDVFRPRRLSPPASLRRD